MFKTCLFCLGLSPSTFSLFLRLISFCLFLICSLPLPLGDYRLGLTFQLPRCNLSLPLFTFNLKYLALDFYSSCCCCGCCCWLPFSFIPLTSISVNSAMHEFSRFQDSSLKLIYTAYLKISSARIRTYDIWIRKQVCYPLHHSAPLFNAECAFDSFAANTAEPFF